VRHWKNVVVLPTQHVVVTAELCVPAFMILNYNDDFGYDQYEYSSWMASSSAEAGKSTSVCVYTCHDTGHTIVVKAIPWADDEDEIKHVRALCGVTQHAIVPARVAYEALKPPGRVKTTPELLNSAFFTCVIMPHGGATLLKVCHANWPTVRDNLPDATYQADIQQKMVSHIEDLVSAATGIAHMCAELLQHGLCYVDLKKSNVLVDPNNNNLMNFCDYGAISSVHDDDACATYPPPDYPNGLKIEASPSVIVYGLGALLFCPPPGRASKQLRRSCGADAQSAFFGMVYVFQIKQ
jgi:hypothetical protein